jgi:acyl-CoA synthetase (AMP-forming)/AMP-acid ligase II
MGPRRRSFAESVLVLIGLGVCLAGGPVHADALSDLNKAFRNAYGQAASQSLADLRGRAPILVNRFGEIALHRPGVEIPDFFSMDMKLYLVSRTVAHTVVAMNARLAPFTSRPLDANALEWLATYQALLTSAADELANRLDEPAMTTAAFEDGFFKTGDLARQRGEGIELIGRAKEIISRGGNKILPIEIDNLFLQHKDVAAAMAVGFADPLLGEALHVLVVAKDNRTLDADALRVWASTRTEKYKIPDGIHVRDALPLGKTGKASRAQAIAVVQQVLVRQ